MSMDGTKDQSVSAKINRLQISLVMQLFQIGTTATHIDELFQWLAYALVDSFDIQLVQFWVSHVNRMGQLTVQLRTMVCQDPSLPVQVVANDQVALVAQRVISERQPARLLAVDDLFLHYQAALLKRYGLNYCVNCFVNKNVLIPPQNNAFSGSPTLFAMTSLLLLRQSPHLDFLPAINGILNQAVLVASNHGLLLPAATDFNRAPLLQQPITPITPIVPVTPIPEPALTLADLIPRRKQDPSLLMSSNPFASSTVIADKRARRFFVAIDGHTNVANLCQALRMDFKEAYAVLQILLVQHRIELYGPDGRLINPSLLFNNL